MAQNGLDREAENTERLISLVVRLNDAILNFSVELRLSSERSERLESAVERLRETVLEIKHHIAEARDELDDIPKREETNPRFRIPPALKDEGDGDGFEITGRQVRLPSAWAAYLLKLGLSAGGGALLLRAVQWFATGH